ncbi:cytochrome d ubiquinol oxidase subunit II [bacterium]|nr:cytochrome d ubiquinol oxidase subunit II [bacterium]
MDLNIVWFLLIGVLLVGYAILDGFDLGAAILQLFAKKEEDRNAILKSIAPFWDGNEVWLLTGGGAIFAAFPHVYATVFSGFYLAMILLLVGLIFRALSIEFRNQVDSPAWKKFWDKAFSFSSLLVVLLLGVALGNIFIGIPLDGQMNYTGSFFTLLRPVPLFVGLTGVFMICTQGAAFLLLKTDKALYQSARSWVRMSWLLFVVFAVLTTIITALTDASKISLLFSSVVGYLATLLLLAGVILVPLFLKKEANFRVFLASSAIIGAMFLVVAGTIFPNMVPAQIPEYSLNIYNASSSQRTLFVMLIIALIGMPIVLGYTAFVHRVFRK